MTETELIELIRQVIAAEGTSEQVDGWLDQFAANIPMPLSTVIELIYYPEGGRTPQPSEVVSKALAYKPNVIRI